MLKQPLFTLEHRGLDSSHPSCLDYKSQLLYTDTGKRQPLEGNSAPQNADGISLGYGTQKLGNFSELGGCSIDNSSHGKVIQKPGTQNCTNMAKDGPQALADGHVGIRRDLGIRNLKSEGLSSTVCPSPPQNQILQSHCFYRKC